MPVVINGTTGVSGVDGSASTPSYQGTDTNTGIFFPAADTIAFGEGGAEAMRITPTGTVAIGTTTNPTAKLWIDSGRVGLTNTYKLGWHSNPAHGDLANYITGDDGSNYVAIGTNATERMRINSSGNVGIGTTSPRAKLSVTNGTENTSGDAPQEVIFTGANQTITSGLGILTVQSNTAIAADVGATIALGGRIRSTGTSTDASNFAVLKGAKENATSDNSAGYFAISTKPNALAPVERMRITSGGDFLFGANQYGRYSSTYEAFITGRTDENIASAGWSASNSGFMGLTRSGATPCAINRLSDDGDLIGFYQATTQEGSISVSGNTVSYNGFSGGHWTQLPEGRGYNPEIPRGTVMSTIGEMCEWKSVVWNEVIEYPAVPAVEAKDAVLDEEGNVVEPAVEAVEGKDAWTETIPHREAYLGNLAVGATFTEDGVTKTVVDDGNERLPKVKISDVVGDKAVYGVFQTWDDVQDMLVTSLGAFVVRIAAGVTVQIGDLLESNGDGCAKVQDDDVIRSKTIGKVTSITPTATYDDGSYTVPCVIYCG